MHVKFIDSILDITADEWNGLCDDYPFIQHEFLAALELSGSTTANTGWQPHHAMVYQSDACQNKTLIAALPLYIKTHSYGEYVFDWSWAKAYGQQGQDYYPKLLTAIPFTPSTGQRVLHSTEISLKQAVETLIKAIKNEAVTLQASGWHCLFPQTELHQQLNQQQISPRLGCQFQWFNNNYQTFTDFINSLVSRKRKNLLKERRTVAKQGLQLMIKTGLEISEHEWMLFYRFYHLTYLKRSGNQGYLSKDFFTRIATTMPNQVVMVIAYHNNEMVAGALNFRDKKNLYGRYWGCAQEYDCLHFEACYYQGIEYAIKEGLQRFDSGAQGEHKIQRGFTPVKTYSNHWITDPMFKQAIDDFLSREEQGMQHYIEEARIYLPFKTHTAPASSQTRKR